MDIDPTTLGKLSRTETEVMRTIWGLSASVTVQQVLDILGKKRGWKTSTLSTILSRLIEKGYLTKAMKGKVNYYTPSMSEDEYKKYETRKFMSAVHNGNVKSFFAALADEEGLSAAEIAELREWFRQRDGGQ
ncbi:MAG: BlaI/MecI/CopY family transcriptional regulator [Clostridiales bacterium]|jgi:BlaI family penicillinase repressor|nr:BlaI/MecI/CopY family transcriptional regulator [Clostridiales bacterium]